MQNKYVLIIEDNAVDYRITHDILEGMGVGKIEHATDGIIAIKDFLSVTNKKHGVPDLILLDLNMIKMSGHIVLKTIRRDSLWNGVPIVILTTSTAQEEIDYLSIELQAHSYISKTNSYKDFKSDIEIVANYWLNVVEVPTKPKSLKLGTQNLNE